MSREPLFHFCINFVLMHLTGRKESEEYDKLRYLRDISPGEWKYIMYLMKVEGLTIWRRPLQLNSLVSIRILFSFLFWKIKDLNIILCLFVFLITFCNPLRLWSHISTRGEYESERRITKSKRYSRRSTEEWISRKRLEKKIRGGILRREGEKECNIKNEWKENEEKELGERKMRRKGGIGMS
jgi:hypothetical protein